MTKLIAIPVNEAGSLDAHFGHCKFFSLIKTEGQTIISEKKIVPPPHEPGLLPQWLSEKGATDIIAGGMGQKAIQLFNEKGVNAFVGAPQMQAQDLANAFLNDNLNLTANYCNHGPDHVCTDH